MSTLSASTKNFITQLLNLIIEIKDKIFKELKFKILWKYDNNISLVICNSNFFLSDLSIFFKNNS